ncbi:hypothetical protein [Microvirga ossetica]
MLGSCGGISSRGSDRRSARCNGHKPCKWWLTDRNYASRWNNSWP